MSGIRKCRASSFAIISPSIRLTESPGSVVIATALRRVKSPKNSFTIARICGKPLVCSLDAISGTTPPYTLCALSCEILWWNTSFALAISVMASELSSQLLSMLKSIATPSISNHIKPPHYTKIDLH